MNIKNITFRFYHYLLFLFICMGFSQTSFGDDDLVSYIRNQSIILSDPSDLDLIIDLASDRKLALLGEASHGTHEYYIWRDYISRRLISEQSFNFIVVEGDFASLFELNRYVKNLPGAAASAREVLGNLDRWPRLMWGNEEIVSLAEWLRDHNNNLPVNERIGFYGMDVYDEWRSKDAVLDLLEQHDNDIFEQVKLYYSCFQPHRGDSWAYARNVQQTGSDCSGQTQAVVDLLINSRDELTGMSDYEYFYLLQNAFVKNNAEKFYRKSVTRQDASSWNSRVHHMHETVNRLLEFYGRDSKGIVWAHNTHIGDARFTEMYQVGNQNIGELSRVHHGPDNVLSIGFTTFKGKVMAGSQWGGNERIKRIVPARRNSIEYIFNKTGLAQFYVVFDDDDRTHDDFMQPQGHRAVGVVFNPANEQRQYVNTILPLRYDVFIFFHQTSELSPLKE